MVSTMSFMVSKIMFCFINIVDNGHKFEARVIRDSLVDVALHLGHN